MNLELFCCSGGLAEGLRRGGVPIDMAFDASPDACESYERNHGHRPIQIDARDLLRLVRAGWSPGPIDLFVADPPCTPWSRAGKRKGTDDERDMLVVTVELVALLRPDAYLIANVPGLDDSTNWPVVQKHLGGLGRHGYCVADYVSLDAADYGVPQHRVRPFWFGHRSGPCLSWPEPTHCDPKRLRTIGLPGTELAPWVTVRQALAHLSREEMGRPNLVRARRRGKDDSLREHDADRPANTLRATRSSSERLLVDEWPWDRPATTVMADNRLAPPGHHGSSFLSATMSWPWDRPSTTIVAGAVQSPPGRNGRKGESQRHHPNAVVLSEKAAAILQGFPEGWLFAGVTKAARWSQIGQAMPPPLAEAVGRQIAKWLRARAGAAA